MSSREPSSLQPWGWDKKGTGPNGAEKPPKSPFFYSVTNLVIQEPEWQEKWKPFCDIPSEFFRRKCIPTKREYAFPFIGLKGLTGQSCTICCLLCSNLSSNIYIKQSQCPEIETHFPYIFLIKGDQLPDEDKDDSKWYLTSKVTWKDTEKLEGEGYLPVTPFVFDKKETFVRSLDLFYWFFLACVLSQIHHPNQPTFLEYKQKELRVLEDFSFHKKIKNLKYLYSAGMFSLGRKKVWFPDTFPLLEKVKEKCMS